MGAIAATLGGGPSGAAVTWAGALLIGLVFLGFSAATTLFHYREAVADKSFSVTNLAASQATFLLGALAVLSDPVAVSAVAVAMTALLAAREGLHGFVSRLTWPELRAAILLLSMTFVALPLVPDQPVAALGGLNFAHIWKLAVILASVSYVGYIAIRLFGGTGGLMLSSAVIGLISSTAATLANARLARQAGAAIPVLAGATLIAGAVSLLRTAALAWGIAPSTATILLPALGAAAFVHAAAGVALAWRHRAPVQPKGASREASADASADTSALANPFELLAVLQIAVLLALVELLAKGAGQWLGSAGVFAVAALSGLADVDAVTLSVGSMVPASLTAGVAATAIVTAVVANIAAKAVYATVLGSVAFGLTYAVPAALSLMVATALLWIG